MIEYLFKEKYFIKREDPKVNDIEVSTGNCTGECKICNLKEYLNEDWASLLENEFTESYFQEIKSHLHRTEGFLPPIDLVFSAMNFCPFQAVKIVILGQDPYHGIGQAMGLSFSVPKNIRTPPSLKNIYEELREDIPGFKIPAHGDLRAWALTGVLLLNDALTVTKNQPGSHSKIGWKHFTKRIFELISEKQQNVVFMLWGAHAREKAVLVDRSKHLVLEAGHPSPFSVKLFRRCKHFSKANEYLRMHGRGQIDWKSL